MGSLARTFGALVATLGVVWASVAAAAEPAALRVGERGYAELLAGERIEIAFDGLSGAVVTAKVRPWTGGNLDLGVELFDPDGASVPIGSNTYYSGVGMVTLKKVRLARSGRYVLAVTAENGTSGGFDVAVSGSYPTKLAGTGTASPGAESEFSFGALAGDSARLRVAPAKRSDARPLLVRFRGADGTDTLLASSTSATVAVQETGTQTAAVSGVGGSEGAYAWSVKLKRILPSKSWRDLDGFIERGSLSGTIFVPGSAPPPGGTPSKRRGPRPAQPLRIGELVVAGAPGETAASVVSALVRDTPGHRFAVLASLTPAGPHLVEVQSIRSGEPRRDEGRTRAMARKAHRSPAVRWAEPNGVVGVTRDPNDAQWLAQDDFRMMRIDAGWDTTTGNSSVVVAVVDTGIWATHPDFAGRLLPGYDFVQSTSSAQDGNGWDSDPTDSSHNFHGTHVAGTIGAATNNRGGVAGVLWNARMVPVRVLGRDGLGSWFDIAAGLRWAAGLPVAGAPSNLNPAKVINLSLGGAGGTQVLADAVQAALSANVVVVAAAGNNSSSQPSYPASYPGVINVSSIAPDGYLASYSNYGAAISVTAPGGDQSRRLSGILSTYVDSGTLSPTYAELNGTSMACPHVAGVAALVLSVAPNLTPAQVKALLESTAIDVGTPGRDNLFGHGLVDAAAVVAAAAGTQPGAPGVTVTPAELSMAPGTDEVTLTIRSSGTGSPTLDAVTATTKFGGPWLSADRSGTSLPATVTVRVDRAGFSAGLYEGAVVLTLSTGQVTVPVRAFQQSEVDPGTIVVAAVNDEGLIVAQTTTARAAGFEYTIEGLPPGNVTLAAWVDRDGDGSLSRVDEWYGRWPLASDARVVAIGAETMHHEALDFAIERLDSRYSFKGVGGGPIRGAVAAFVFDAATGDPISGARVHVGSAAASGVTDESGRAVLSGAFTGAQTVTASADGCHPLTTIDCNAQYQSFALEPVEFETCDVTVTVWGLDDYDDEVVVQVGNQFDLLYYPGTGPLTTTLTVAVGMKEIPVWVFSKDLDGLPSMVDLATIYPENLGTTASVSLFPDYLDGGYWYLPDTVLRRPTSGMDAASTDLIVTEEVWYDDEDSLVIGLDWIPHNTYSTIYWASFGDADSELPATTFASAYDGFGRESHVLIHGTVDTLGFTEWLTLPSPPVLSSPASGAINQSLSPTLAFAPTQGADLNLVEIEDESTGRYWTITAPGGATSVRVPNVLADGLKGGSSYRWRVLSFELLGFDYHSYLDDDLLWGVESITGSDSRVFRTQ